MSRPPGCSSRCLLPGCGKPSAGRTQGLGCPSRPAAAGTYRQYTLQEALGEPFGQVPWRQMDQTSQLMSVNKRGPVSFSSMDRDDNDTTHRMRPFQQILTHQRRSSGDARLVNGPLVQASSGTKHNKGASLVA